MNSRWGRVPTPSAEDTGQRQSYKRMEKGAPPWGDKHGCCWGLWGAVWSPQNHRDRQPHSRTSPLPWCTPRLSHRPFLFGSQV